MLPTVQGLHLPDLPIKNRRLIADLIYFDGALLPYYRDNGKGHYLYYWCDADESHNRWLVVRVEEYALRSFLARQTTLRQLLLRVERAGSYLLDVNGDGQPTQILRVEVADLPDDYLPADETWYDASLSVFTDHLAARELMSMMQDSLQEAQSKLEQIERIITRAPEVLQRTPVPS
ncbi:MAG: hypothetical protein KJZ86_18000 [Caldilineaceae bacterium]|nr:hypothetical protein [Caldilineaceae bacterium]HRJ42002.1 hypothetical protein [Caldilineaceae bacterium]